MNNDIKSKLNPELIQEKEIDGVKYIAQLLPTRAAMTLRQGWQDSNGNAIAVDMHDAVLKNIIVQPAGLTVDDFKRTIEVEKITGWALNFQYGDEKN